MSEAPVGCSGQARWTLNKIQERQASGPWEPARGWPLLPHTGKQQLVQKAAIHLWQSANGAFWDRTLVGGSFQVTLHRHPAVKSRGNAEACQ